MPNGPILRKKGDLKRHIRPTAHRLSAREHAAAWLQAIDAAAVGKEPLAPFFASRFPRRGLRDAPPPTTDPIAWTKARSAERALRERSVGVVTNVSALSAIFDHVIKRTLTARGAIGRRKLHADASIVNKAWMRMPDGRKFFYFDIVDRGRPAIRPRAGRVLFFLGRNTDPETGGPEIVWTKKARATRPYRITARANAEIRGRLPELIERDFRRWVDANVEVPAPMRETGRIHELTIEGRVLEKRERQTDLGSLQRAAREVLGLEEPDSTESYDRPVRTPDRHTRASTSRDIASVRRRETTRRRQTTTAADEIPTERRRGVYRETSFTVTPRLSGLQLHFPDADRVDRVLEQLTKLSSTEARDFDDVIHEMTVRAGRQIERNSREFRELVKTERARYEREVLDEARRVARAEREIAVAINAAAATSYRSARSFFGFARQLLPTDIRGGTRSEPLSPAREQARLIFNESRLAIFRKMQTLSTADAILAIWLPTIAAQIEVYQKYTPVRKRPRHVYGRGRNIALGATPILRNSYTVLAGSKLRRYLKDRDAV